MKKKVYQLTLIIAFLLTSAIAILYPVDPHFVLVPAILAGLISMEF